MYLLWNFSHMKSLDLTDEKSTLVQVMAWCCQATSHYLSQCWLRSMLPYGVTRPQWINSYGPETRVFEELPGHQQPWYWLYRINWSLFYMRKVLGYPCHLDVEKLYKWKNISMFPAEYVAYINSLVPGRCGHNIWLVLFKLISRIDIFSNSCEIALRWMPPGLAGDLSTQVPVMTWFDQTISH